jgi:hypothetical protein
MRLAEGPKFVAGPPAIPAALTTDFLINAKKS